MNDSENPKGEKAKPIKGANESPKESTKLKLSKFNDKVRKQPIEKVLKITMIVQIINAAILISIGILRWFLVSEY